MRYFDIKKRQQTTKPAEKTEGETAFSVLLS